MLSIARSGQKSQIIQSIGKRWPRQREKAILKQMAEIVKNPESTKNL